jgi:hypothetical protein
MLDGSHDRVPEDLKRCLPTALLVNSPALCNAHAVSLIPTCQGVVIAAGILRNQNFEVCPNPCAYVQLLGILEIDRLHIAHAWNRT